MRQLFLKFFCWGWGARYWQHRNEAALPASLLLGSKCLAGGGGLVTLPGAHVYRLKMRKILVQQSFNQLVRFRSLLPQ